MVVLHEDSWLNMDKFTSVYGGGKEPPSILWMEDMHSEFNRAKIPFFMFSILALILFCLIILNRDDWESLAWGAFLIFMFLSIITYYYYFLMLLAILFYKRRVNFINTLSLVFLFFIQIAGHILHLFKTFYLHMFYVLSLLLLIYFIYIVTADLIALFKEYEI